MYRNLISKIDYRQGKRIFPFPSTFLRKYKKPSALQKRLDLSGIFPPIATPFKEGNEDIDWDKLQANVLKWEEIPFKGYVVHGSNGEYVSLSTEERIEMIKRMRRYASDEKMIISGSGCESTRATVKLTQQMADAGADAALVVTPAFFKARMNEAAMMHHYTTIAEASPIPIILYNVPENTGLDFPVKAIFELAKHPNIIGLKDSSGNITNLANILHETSSDDFQVLAGSGSYIFPALQLGAVGVICALANVLGKRCCDLLTLTNEGKYEEARRLQLSLIEPNLAVTKRYKVPGMKYAMSLFGYYGGPSRSPLIPLTKEESADVKKSFTEFL